MSYDSIIGHRTMALDGVRNAAYQAALESIITPDSVVLDLGAGLGTLGMLAARLGARRVYLVEPSNVVSVTRELVHRNGLQARVRVLQGRIEDLELPEPVDVITSVMTGNFLLSEDLLPSLFHARDKYLKPGGRLLPSEAVMEVMPVSLPTYYAEHVACWQQPHLGLDFGAAQEAATNSIYWSRSKFAAATPLAPAQPLLHMDLDAAQSTHCRATTEFSLTTDGSLHGWLGWFRMQLGEAWLSTSPFEPLTHWGSAFLPLPQAQDGHAGDAAGFSLLRPPGGPWSWTEPHPHGRLRPRDPRRHGRRDLHQGDCLAAAGCAPGGGAG
ncbi:MAG: class I SAM-dependent methyltransferase [Planctomycetota bacterium]|nr:class I SAM-dependent methyltransferase [Planctomycetota bacterium]